MFGSDGRFLKIYQTRIFSLNTPKPVLFVYGQVNFGETLSTGEKCSQEAKNALNGRKIEFFGKNPRQ